MEVAFLEKLLTESTAIAALLFVLLWWCHKEKREIFKDMSRTIDRIATVLDIRKRNND